MSDTARQRRVSFGEAALLPQATSATASGPPLSDVLEEAFAEAAASSAGSADSLPVDELGGLLANMGLVDASDAGTFMQQQRVLAAGAPSAKRGDFAQLVNALDEWRQAVPQVVESGARLDASLVAKLESFFSRLDIDGDGQVTREEATKRWHGKFANVNVGAMFNEVDTDGDGKITYDEWMAFWGNVVRYGYTSAEVEEEVDELLEGGAWVDFNDGRTTARGNE